MGTNELHFWLWMAGWVFLAMWLVIALVIGQFAHMRLGHRRGFAAGVGFRYMATAFFLSPIAALLMLHIEMDGDWGPGPSDIV